MDTISNNLNNAVSEIRQLQIDFDLYTEGDAAFRRELAAMIAANIDEFQKELHCAIKDNDTTSFSRAFHKAKAVLTMINDSEYMELTQHIKNRLATGDRQSLQPLVSSFDRLSGAIAQSLRIVASS